MTRKTRTTVARSPVGRTGRRSPEVKGRISVPHDRQHDAAAAIDADFDPGHRSGGSASACSPASPAMALLTAAEIDECSASRRQGRLCRAVARFVAPHVEVPDRNRFIPSKKMLCRSRYNGQGDWLGNDHDNGRAGDYRIRLALPRRRSQPSDLVDDSLGDRTRPRRIDRPTCADRPRKPLGRTRGSPPLSVLPARRRRPPFGPTHRYLRLQMKPLPYTHRSHRRIVC